MSRIYLKIEGIYCAHCEETIRNALMKNGSVKKVEIKGDIATVFYVGDIDSCDLVERVCAAGYQTKPEYVSCSRRTLLKQPEPLKFVMPLAVVLTAALSIKCVFGIDIFNLIPTIDSSITYEMLVVTGLFTSIHCISMCGAINLSASVGFHGEGRIVKPVLYNVGRVISYTVIGGMVGLLGSVLQLNAYVSGAVILAAGVLMLLMSLGMTGMIPFRLSGLFHIKSRSSNVFIIGLLNGLMPCGPLQAMQLYALSTGSFYSGALSMFLFGIGTVPLMLSVGILMNSLRGRGRILLNRMASALILVLSLVMVNRGLLTLGIDLFRSADDPESYLAAEKSEDGVQRVTFDLTYNQYSDIIVQKGVPVNMIIHADENYLTGCNNEVVCRELGFEKKLEAGDNVITFVPEETGTYVYTCWMSMIKNTIKVIDDEAYFENAVG